MKKTTQKNAFADPFVERFFLENIKLVKSNFYYPNLTVDTKHVNPLEVSEL
jgi:hypothetical protein